jgi:hypothetical protein
MEFQHHTKTNPVSLKQQAAVHGNPYISVRQNEEESLTGRAAS